MPETFDLDAAFETLTHDVSRSTHPRGAEGAIRVARRRRTALVALAAAVVVAVSGVAISQLGGGSPDSAPFVANDETMPAPAPLTAEVFDEATSGWLNGWQPDPDGSLLTMHNCAEQVAINTVVDSKVLQYSLGSGAPKASVVLTLHDSAADAEATRQLLEGTGVQCGGGPATPIEAPAGVSAAMVSYYVGSRNYTGDRNSTLIIVRTQDRLGLVAIGGVSWMPPEQVQHDLARALLAGLLDADLRPDGRITEEFSSTVEEIPQTEGSGSYSKN